MSTSTTLYRQYQTLIRNWPIDNLRPNFSFAETLQRRAAEYFGTHVEADSSLPTQNTDKISASPGLAGSGKPVLKFDESGIQREINVLGALLEDRFKKAVGFPCWEVGVGGTGLTEVGQYPLGDNMLHPKGNPEYYDKLMKELHTAPERSWLGGKLSSWKGWIRME